MLKNKKFFGLLTALIALSMFAAACSGGGGSAPQSTTPPSASSGGGGGSTGGGSAPSGDETAAESNVYPENGLPKDEKVTIRVGFREQGYGREWFDFAVEKFTERYPNVSFDITASPNLGTLLSPLIASGDNGAIYDLFYPDFEGKDTFRELTEQGKFEPVDELWDRELIGEPGVTLRSVISDSAYRAFSTLFGGTTTYNLPAGSYTTGLFYDDALFTEKGWNKNPRTWDEFVALLESIKQDGMIPITYPGMYPDYLTGFTFDMYPWAMAHKRGIFEEYEKHYSEVGQPQYTHDLVKEEFSLIYELGKKGYFPEGVAALNHTQSQMQVLQRRAAMVSSGDWIGNEMKDATPEGFTWGFMGVPFTDDPNDPVFLLNNFSTSSMVIWKDKPELVKAWAKEFLLSLYDFDVQIAMAKASIYPARTDFSDDPSRVDQLEEVAKAVAAYTAQHNIIAYSPRRTVTMTSPAFGQAKKTIDEATPGISEGKTDPIPVLEAAEQFVTQAWNEQ